MLNANSASLAEVAYAQVIGATGLSPNLNSGVATARTGAGTYTITLPQGEGQTHDLIFVQILGTVPLLYAADVDDTDPSIKRVMIGSSATTAVDADFSVIVMRSLLTPPPGAPA
jgi:hypothetical protein